MNHRAPKNSAYLLDVALLERLYDEVSDEMAQVLDSLVERQDEGVERRPKMPWDGR